MPKATVIVPVYNVKSFLKKCVDSILAQTLSDFELLLVDDGSTDGSGDLCDQLALEDSLGVSIPDDALTQMKTVGDIVSYLEANH